MHIEKTAVLQIVNAMFFALAIVLASYLLLDTQYVEYSDTVTNILIALWIIPMGFIHIKGKKSSAKS